jgi:hypothetical protein
MSNDFYLRYYVGHKGKFGHEFLEFEFRPDGKLRSVTKFLFIRSRMLVAVCIELIGLAGRAHSCS